VIGNVPKKKRQETIVWCYSLVSSNIAGCKNEGSPTAHRAFLLRNVYMECVCVCVIPEMLAMMVLAGMLVMI